LVQRPIEVIGSSANNFNRAGPGDPKGSAPFHFMTFVITVEVNIRRPR